MDMKLHSRKTFFLLLALTVVTGCRKDPFLSDLERLDRVIEQRDEYRERFEAGAVPIRQSFDKAESDSLRWVMADSLRKYYMSFSLDSVERYTRRMGLAAANREQKFRTEISGIRFLALKNMEMTALDWLYQLDTAAYDREGLRRYRLWTEVRLLIEAKHHHSKYHHVPLDTLILASRLRYAREDTVSYQGRINLAHLFAEGGDTERGLAIMKDLYDRTESLHWKAVFSNYMAYFNGLADNPDEKKHWLIMSSIHDYEAANMNYLSPYQLARILYKEGDFERSARYMRQTLTDVSVAGFNQRMRFSGPALAVVGTALDREHARSDHFLNLIILTLLVLFLAVLLLMTLLARRSRMLEKTNRLLQDANNIRDNYIIRYMTLATEYLEEPERQRKELKQILRSGGPDALVKKLRQPSGIHERYQGYFKSFDETFLKLYPDFISKVNALLSEEARFPETREAELPTELRILAAIRIGITESGEIARFLNCSPSTVYTYRSRLKAAALCGKDRFEEMIKTL